MSGREEGSPRERGLLFELQRGKRVVAKGKRGVEGSCFLSERLHMFNCHLEGLGVLSARTWLPPLVTGLEERLCQDGHAPPGCGLEPEGG